MQCGYVVSTRRKFSSQHRYAWYWWLRDAHGVTTTMVPEEVFPLLSKIPHSALWGEVCQLSSNIPHSALWGILDDNWQTSPHRDFTIQWQHILITARLEPIQRSQPGDMHHQVTAQNRGIRASDPSVLRGDLHCSKYLKERVCSHNQER